MLCCSNCFGEDKFLNDLINSTGTQSGHCNYCGTQTERLISAEQLQGPFEFLLSIYEASVDGRPIIECLQEDWELFKDKNPIQSLELLIHITHDETLRNETFRVIGLNEITPKEKWIKFCDELVQKFRFFPDHAPSNDYMKLLLDSLNEPITGHLYRARIESSEKIPKKLMGMPPPNLATGGRANPVGIPYFYAASNLQTAIAETRPHPGNNVTVAKFAITGEINVVNLINPISTISPFNIAYEQGDEEYLLKLRYDVEFLSHLGDILSKPVTPNDAVLKYLPTQFLCEQIKKSGFGGVKFKSSVGTGVNFALFGEEQLKAMSVSSHSIKSLEYISISN